MAGSGGHRGWAWIPALAGMTVLLCGTAWAEPMYQYRDEQGKVRYTNDPSSIPQKPAKPPAREKKQAPGVARETGDVLPSELVRAFNANALAAEGRFKGRILTVYGLVSEIDEAFGKPYVVLAGGVMCHFGVEARSALLKLRRGQAVRIRGECQGKLLHLISLTGCSLAGW